MGLTLGTGYRLNDKVSGMTIGVKYYYGLVNVYKGHYGTHNSSLFLEVNIPIGAGKASDKKGEAEVDYIHLNIKSCFLKKSSRWFT